MCKVFEARPRCTSVQGAEVSTANSNALAAAQCPGSGARFVGAVLSCAIT